jgi:hypothetical protein
VRGPADGEEKIAIFADKAGLRHMPPNN